MIGFILPIACFIFLFPLKSLGSSELWILTSAPRAKWYSIASDSSGQYLSALANGGGIYTSANYGSTWTQTTAPNENWYSITSDSTGKYLAAVVDNGGIYSSVDYGFTWSQTVAPSRSWLSIASDGTGQYLSAVDSGGGIYISFNNGSTWTQSSAPNENWYSITSDSTGMYQAAVVDDGGIYTSTNYGSTWMQTIAPTKSWLSIASDSTGKNMSAVDSGGGIYISLDYGSTWTQTSAPNENWRSITSDSSGQFLYAAVYNGGIYISENYGTNWTLTSAPTENWYSIATDSTGQNLVAVAYDGGIYFLASSPTSQPSSSPTSRPTSLPSSPTSCPSSQPSNCPSGCPLSAPSSSPSSQPTQNPTFMSGSQIYDFESVTGSDNIPQVTATLSNFGYDLSQTYYLTVSFLQTGFGGIVDGNSYVVNIYVGDELTGLCYACSVDSKCGDDYVTCNGCVNQIVTKYISTNVGGSLTVKAIATVPWTSQLCHSNPSFTVQYELSLAQPNPTYMPTSSSSHTLNPFVPLTFVLISGLIAAVYGLFIWYIRRSEASLHRLSILSVLYSLTAFASSFVSQLFFGYVCFSKSSYLPFAVAWLVVRCTTMTISTIYIYNVIKSADLSTFLNWQFMGARKKVYGLVVVSSFFQPTLIRLLPWKKSDVSCCTAGFPSFQIYYLTTAIHILEMFLLDVVHIWFAVDMQDLLTLSEFDQISYFLSTGITFIVGLISFVEIWLVMNVASTMSLKNDDVSGSLGVIESPMVSISRRNSY